RARYDEERRDQGDARAGRGRSAAAEVNSGLSTETSGGITFETGRAERKSKTYSEMRGGDPSSVTKGKKN
ncbi:MAG TPA: hypothetical protein H9757_10530, partial [Candidatus Mediterraneibacter faecigallinarum]|nr:hypothetical protein [Candidatus Mediterraneibacter faecigallinarum]